MSDGADYGSQGIKWRRPPDNQPYMWGERDDGAIVRLAPADKRVGGAECVHNETIDTIARLYHFGMLGKEQRGRIRRDALNQLRQDYMDAGINPRVGMSYNPLGSGGADREDLINETAYRAWQDAVRALGPILSATIIPVAIEDRPPKRMVDLINGADRLAVHYKLLSQKAVDTR